MERGGGIVMADSVVSMSPERGMTVFPGRAIRSDFNADNREADNRETVNRDCLVAFE